MTAVSHPDNGPVDEAGAALAEPGGPATDQADAALAEPSGPETESPGTPRWRLDSPVLQGGIAFLIYLVVWVTTAFRPIISHLTWMQLNQKSQDPNIFSWSLGWWPYAIGHGINPLYTHELMASAGHNLSWVTTVPPLALLAAPLTLAASPVVSFNLLVALAAPLSAWAGFLLCRRLTGKFWAALAGGAVFGFSAFEGYHSAWGQLNLAYAMLLPILGYIIVAWWQGGIRNRTFVILAALTIALQYYLYLEVFANMTAFLVIALVLGFALAGSAGRGAILRLGKYIGLAYIVAMVLAAPDIVYTLSSKAPRPVPVTSTDLASLVIPQPARVFGITWLAHAAAFDGGQYNLSTACYVGVPLLVLVILLAVTTWQSRLVRFLCCMLVIVTVASLGPVVMLNGHPKATVPWSGLFHLPFVRNATPVRMMVFAYLVLAVAAALWLAGPAKRVQWARWPLAVLVIVFIALDAFPIKVKTHSEVPPFISTAQYRRQLSPGEIVVVVSNDGNTAMLWQSESGFYMRIVGGYINEGINRGSDLPRPVEFVGFPTPSRVASFEQYVKTDHIGAILLDVSNKPVPGWAVIFPVLGLVGHNVGGVVVYPTHGCDACRTPTRAELAKVRAEVRRSGLPSRILSPHTSK
jgi:hypothetical protein